MPGKLLADGQGVKSRGAISRSTDTTMQLLTPSDSHLQNKGPSFKPTSYRLESESCYDTCAWYLSAIVILQ